MSVMEKLLQDFKFKPLQEGDIITGTVIQATRNLAWVDIEERGMGVIIGKELGGEKLKPGDEVTASIVELESAEGYMVLSLRRASRNQVWQSFEDAKEQGKAVSLKVVEANQGGLILEQKGVRGFMPTSQLAKGHYPQVGGNRKEIALKLQELVGQTLDVKVIDCNAKTNKLIFSEKDSSSEPKIDVSKKFKVGQKIKGKVTGVVDFGAFVEIGGMDGLVHISEISWDKVLKIEDYLKVGDEVEVLVIDVNTDKVFLSIKRLKEDPWQEKIKKYKEGQLITGEVTRITPFGAFVKLEANIEGLAHISELSREHIKTPYEVLAVGDVRAFKIASVDAKSRKISLNLKDVGPTSPATKSGLRGVNKQVDGKIGPSTSLRTGSKADIQEGPTSPRLRGVNGEVESDKAALKKEKKAEKKSAVKKETKAKTAKKTIKKQAEQA